MKIEPAQTSQYHCPETETLCSKCESHCEAAQPVQPSTSAEDYLRGRYGAYRGHFAWRELEEAFNAGKQSQPVQPAGAQSWEPVGEIQIEDMGQPFNAMRVRVHFYKEVPPVGAKIYTAPPAVAVNEQMLSALIKAEDAMTWELGGEPCGLQTALLEVRSAIAAAEAAKKGGV